MRKLRIQRGWKNRMFGTTYILLAGITGRMSKLILGTQFVTANNLAFKQVKTAHKAENINVNICPNYSSRS